MLNVFTSSCISIFSMFTGELQMSSRRKCKIDTRYIIHNSSKHQNQENPKNPAMMYPLPARQTTFLGYYLILCFLLMLIVFIFTHHNLFFSSAATLSNRRINRSSALKSAFKNA